MMDHKVFDLGDRGRIYVRKPCDSRPINIMVDASHVMLGSMFPEEAEEAAKQLLEAAKQARLRQAEHDQRRKTKQET
ncbi:hypothetical protein M0R72_10550 [Candidatus Pacearchaeota archaeon]|jgi:hypothetical protein|nr:hypothetical protein [Candidatus Pacearchaeota archaeon]